MHRPLLGAVLLAATAAAAAATQRCLTIADAAHLSNTFAFLVSQWNANPAAAERLCNQTLTPDFVDYSDSIRVIESGGCTPNPQPLDRNRYQFILDQATLPPFDFEVGKIWSNCDTITFRWHSHQTPNNVTGIVVLETAPNPLQRAAERFQIKATYSEFNSATWAVNLHKLTPSNCSAGA